VRSYEDAVDVPDIAQERDACNLIKGVYVCLTQQQVCLIPSRNRHLSAVAQDASEQAAESLQRANKQEPKKIRD
jgi:hypothetical protein